jgi:hypothetical protein
MIVHSFPHNDDGRLFSPGPIGMICFDSFPHTLYKIGAAPIPTSADNRFVGLVSQDIRQIQKNRHRLR